MTILKGVGAGLRRALQRLAQKFRGRSAWRAWSGLGLILLLLAYLGYVLRSVDAGTFDLGGLLSRLAFADVGVIALLYGITLVLAILTWGLIIGSISGYHRPFEDTRSYLLTSVTRRLPGTFWYMLGRVVLYERLGVARGLTALASGLEFLAMVLGGVLIALLTWPLAFGGQRISLLGLLITLVACAALLNPPLVRALIRRFGQTAGAPPVRYRQLLLWVTLYGLIWCVGGLILFVLVRAVQPLPVHMLPAMIGIWATAGVAATLFFSFLPFGLGATEVTMAAMLSPFVAPDEALFIAVALRVILTLCELAYGLLGGLLYLPDLLARRGPFASPPDAESALESGETVGSSRPSGQNTTKVRVK